MNGHQSTWSVTKATLWRYACHLDKSITAWREYAIDNRFIKINSSFIFVQQIFFAFSFNFCFLFWTQWSWAGQKLSKALYGVHQTSDSSSIRYYDSGFHSGDLSKTGVFTHRWFNVIRLPFSHRNETVFCTVLNALVVVKIFVKTFSYNFYYYDWLNLFFINGIFSVRRSRNFVI